ncbi:hypothetical protein SETIT_9G304000v2 [Setaria italica]|uniref:Amino acid transporter transmembrane domain-containing protein n=1 Tax=Setaria italica TaxID=4555 RepID=A0A368SP58_SETIT|nr:hypothetical protein SETIT_9G304000v2 [Setaria italica]
MFCFALVTYMDVVRACLDRCSQHHSLSHKHHSLSVKQLYAGVVSWWPWLNNPYVYSVRVCCQRTCSGKKHTWACGSLQYVSLYGCGVAYAITTATSIRAILKANCYYDHGHDAPCDYGGSSSWALRSSSSSPSYRTSTTWLVWLSVVAAVMSFSCAFIGFGLGLATTISNGRIKGSVPMRTKIWRVSQAIGDIAFLDPTGNTGHPQVRTGREQDDEEGVDDLHPRHDILLPLLRLRRLTGFGFYEPYWLMDFANACIILQLLGGQVTMMILLAPRSPPAEAEAACPLLI